MNATKLDPRARRRGRLSRSIRRFLMMMGLERREDRHRPQAPTARAAVQVWDGRRGCYRMVDPDDHVDPLHETASVLAKVRAESGRAERQAGLTRDSENSEPDTEAGRHSAPEAPRSPFGGGNLLATDLQDE